MTAIEWCEAHGIAIVHFLSVKMIIDKLIDDELVIQVNIAIAQLNPVGTNGWEKIKTLYDERSTPPTMRQDELEIMMAIAGPRIREALELGDSIQ